ncbi:MAG TPA: DUF951 domain-containing protein [Anaerolineaceae bacterium]
MIITWGWYNLGVLPDLRLEDVLALRKPHPCGGNEWRVVRLGADIGLECKKCGRQMLLPRRDLARRVKKFISRGADDPKNA